MSKTEVIHIRVSPEIKAAAVRMAAEDGRSVSNWLAELIKSANARD